MRIVHRLPPEWFHQHRLILSRTQRRRAFGHERTCDLGQNGVPAFVAASFQASTAGFGPTSKIGVDGMSSKPAIVTGAKCAGERYH